MPSWLPLTGFCSVTRTADELSVVCAQEVVPPGVRAARDRRLISVDGPLDFDLVGILAKLSSALADAGVSLFALSTYDTDCLLVREQDVPSATAALAAVGCVVRW